jgi:hypothetical protein
MKKPLSLFLLLSFPFAQASFFPDVISEKERIAAGCLYLATQYPELAALAITLETQVCEKCNADLWYIATTGGTGFFTSEECRAILRQMANNGYDNHKLQQLEAEAYARSTYRGKRNLSKAIYDAVSSQAAYPGASSNVTAPAPSNTPSSPTGSSNSIGDYNKAGYPGASSGATTPGYDSKSGYPTDSSSSYPR